jgi:hypothetical protein
MLGQRSDTGSENFPAARSGSASSFFFLFPFTFCSFFLVLFIPRHALRSLFPYGNKRESSHGWDELDTFSSPLTRPLPSPGHQQQLRPFNY